MKEKRNTLSSKLTPKSTEFYPVQAKPQIDEHLESVMQIMMISNQGQVYANDFQRLDSYVDINDVRSFPSLSLLNSAEYKLEGPNGLGFVVVTSSSADDIHKCMKYGIWASTKEGNTTLMRKFIQRKKGELVDVIVFFRIRDEKRFVGCARLISNYIEEQQYDLWWERVEWKGLFNVQWLFAKNLDISKIEDCDADEMIDGVELDQELGFQILKKFITTPYSFNDSILQLFCVLDRREDNLISLRSKTSFSKHNNGKNRKLKF